MLFDTGSADLILFSTACDTCKGHNLYDPSKSCTACDLGKPYYEKFGDASKIYAYFNGTLYTDDVNVAGYMVSLCSLSRFLIHQAVPVLSRPGTKHLPPPLTPQKPSIALTSLQTVFLGWRSRTFRLPILLLSSRTLLLRVHYLTMSSRSTSPRKAQSCTLEELTTSFTRATLLMYPSPKG